MGASTGQPTMGAGAGGGIDLASNANLAQMPQASFSAGSGSGAPQFGAFNSVDMAGSMPSTQMADFSQGMPQTPAAQANAGVTAENNIMDQFKQGFGGEEAKKLAKDLAGMSQQKDNFNLSPVSTQGGGAGGQFAPVNLYAGIQPSQAPSGAMQAITTNVPQPQGIMGRI